MGYYRLTPTWHGVHQVFATFAGSLSFCTTCQNCG